MRICFGVLKNMGSVLHNENFVHAVRRNDDYMKTEVGFKKRKYKPGNIQRSDFEWPIKTIALFTEAGKEISEEDYKNMISGRTNKTWATHFLKKNERGGGCEILSEK